MNVTCKIDASGLNAALAKAQQYSRRAPAEACNTAGLEVAIGAKNRMPVTTIQTIDSELAVIVTPKLGKRGKPVKGKQFTPQKTAANPDVPLAVLIAQARANPNSRYNQLTGGRYAIAASPFKGLSRAAGRAAMAAFVSKMIGRRHSSIAVLKASLIPIINKLKNLTSNRFRRAGTGMDGDGKYFGGNLGTAIPAQANSTVAQCVLMAGTELTGKNAESLDRALQTHGAPAWQAAIDSEGRASMDYYLKKSSEELARDFNAAAG